MKFVWQGGMSIVAAGMLATGCAQQVRKQTTTICGDDGCMERSADYAAPTPPTDPAAVEAKRQEAALKALAKNDPGAAYDLGLRFFRGDGVKQNSYEALTWMRSAAQRGDLEAQKALGRLYLTGLEEMGADYQEAEKWLMIAAGRGDQESETLLAEATHAKRSEQALHQWRRHWRPIFYRYWYHSYRYRTYWRNGYWVHY